MDVYLPADFHALHDAAAPDWRDLSTRASPDCQPAPADPEPREDCPDPTWRVL